MSELKSARPLSPHLQIYRFRPTMAMSILHRITGGALYVGTILVVWWLVAAASGPVAFSYASWFFGSFLGRLILFGYSWALIQHAAGGVRHFIWDTGSYMGKEESTRLALATLAFSLVFTAILWIAVIAI